MPTHNPEPASPEAPIAWRCWWTLATSVPPFKGQPERLEFPTKLLADRKHTELLAQFGDQVATCIVPVFRQPPDTKSKAAKRRSLDALGWPVQLSPAALAKAAKRR
jgi:hypothetical protein